MMMSTKWLRLAAGALGLVITSCGSTNAATGGTSSASNSLSTNSVTAVATDAPSVTDAPSTTETDAPSDPLEPEYKTMTEMLDFLASHGVACGPYVQGEHTKLGTREWGDCTWDGSTFFVALGSGNAEQTREHLDAFQGMASGYVLLSGNSYINTDDSALAGVLAEKLGMVIL